MTWLYKYTELGYIVAWILEWKLKDVQTEKIKNTIYELFQKVLRSNNSYGLDFLADFYKKVMEYDKNVQPGLFNSLLSWMVAALTSEHIKYEKVGQYLNIAQIRFLEVGTAPKPEKPLNNTPIDIETKEMLSKLYLQTFDELPEEIRKILLYENKIVTESGLLRSVPPNSGINAG
jgi:hypothetical protein